MDFSLNEEQKMLLETVRRFIREHLSPLEEEVEREGLLKTETAQALHQKSKALGLFALNMPSALGGGGLSVMDRILCEEQFGHTSDILVRRAFGNVYEPLLECKAEQIERWLKPTVQGARTCSIAITEPGAGSDAQGIKTHAKKAATGWVLNGNKHFISDGLWSDFFLVSAKTGEREISMFMVDKGLAGFSIGKDQPMMGLRGTSHAELFFDNVALENACLLGEQGQGFKLAMGGIKCSSLGSSGGARGG
jgi:acyl-CoA dehydrogenase